MFSNILNINSNNNKKIDIYHKIIWNKERS